MSEVEINGISYQIGKLDAFKQFHLARRITPMFATLAVASQNFEGLGEGEKPSLWQIVEKLAGPISEELAKKSDEEMDHILWPCLAAVRRKVAGDHWMPLKAAGANRLMYEDIDGLVLVRLAVEVIKENLAGFFSFALPASVVSGGQAKP